MPTNLDYKKIRELRQLIMEEVVADVTVVTVEHLKLVEMKVQTVLMAGLGPDDVVKERTKWQKN